MESPDVKPYVYSSVHAKMSMLMHNCKLAFIKISPLQMLICTFPHLQVCSEQRQCTRRAETREGHYPFLPPNPLSQIRPSCISMSRAMSACRTLDKGTERRCKAIPCPRRKRSKHSLPTT